LSAILSLLWLRQVRRRFLHSSRARQISFPEAVRLIAEKVGIPLPKMRTAQRAKRKTRRRGRLIEMH